MIKQLIIITIVDFVAIGLWVKSIDPDPSVSIFVLIIVPILIILNAIVGLILKIKRNKWSNSFFINSILSSIIFYNLFVYQIGQHVADKYKSFYFKNDNKNYELVFNLDKGHFENNLKFEFFHRENSSSSTMGLSGQYVTSGDTIRLTSDSGRIMKIYKTSLIDYPKKGDKVEMANRLK